MRKVATIAPRAVAICEYSFACGAAVPPSCMAQRGIHWMAPQVPRSDTPARAAPKSIMPMTWRPEPAGSRPDAAARPRYRSTG
ncbi:MAG: hypothetical protein EBX36_04875 [Planctomycetia bacterium]|nr:hypothetical protein [Planctomycetia bacterium]